MDKNRFKLLNILTPKELKIKEREDKEKENVRLLRIEKKKIKEQRILESERLKKEIINDKLTQVKHIFEYDYFPSRKIKAALPLCSPPIQEQEQCTLGNSDLSVFTYDYKSHISKLKIASPSSGELMSTLDFSYIDKNKKFSENTCFYYIQAIKHLVKYINILISQINDIIYKDTDWMMTYPDNTFSMTYSNVKASDWLLDLVEPPPTEKTREDILNANYYTNMYPHTISQPDKQIHNVDDCFKFTYELNKRDINIVPPQTGIPVPINKIWMFDYSDRENFDMGLYMYVEQYHSLLAYYSQIQDRLARLILMKELGLFYYKITLEFIAQPYNIKSLKDTSLRTGMVVRAESIREGMRICLSRMPNIEKDVIQTFEEAEL